MTADVHAKMETIWLKGAMLMDLQPIISMAETPSTRDQAEN